MTQETSIPFAGFYESIHSDQLEQALQQTFEDDHGNILDEELFNKANDNLDWQKVHLHYVQAYVKAFADCFDLKSLKFQELSSPREYNFTTDRIFCTIDSAEVERLYSEVVYGAGNTGKLNKLIASKFTSRSGFISFYDNSLAAWGSDLSKWDANQVGTLIECAVEYSEDSFDELEVFSVAHEIASSAIDAGGNPEFFRLCSAAHDMRSALEIA